MNTSVNKESINLNKKKKYIVIDGLYLNSIKDELHSIDEKNLYSDIRNKIFPYSDTPFAEFIPRKTEFNINQIKRVPDDSLSLEKENNLFSTDTGLIFFVEVEIFLKFIKIYSYDDLLNSSTDIINKSYLENIFKNFPENSVGILLTPGIGSGVEFVGSGTYKITNDNKKTN